LSPHEEIKLLDCLNQGLQGVIGCYKGLQAVKRG